MTTCRSHRVIRWSAVATVLVLSLVGAWAPRADSQEATASPESIGTWRQVSAGSAHTCGIRPTGHLYCWGYDAFSQLGDGGPDEDKSTPVEVFGGGANWASVSAGGGHTCAVKTTGRLYCWGEDSRGQVGDGAPGVNQAIPRLVAGGITDWAVVDATGLGTCAIRTNGRLYCWGNDDGGRLGDGGMDVDQPAPVPVASSARDWVSVASAIDHTCARRATGRLFCWGSDQFGQLGTSGPNQAQAMPVQVAGAFTDWRSVDAGDFSTCATRADGVLYCWGNDYRGKLGNGGADIDRPTPTRVAGERSARWETVSVAAYHACATRTTGRLYCWGEELNGELGDGTMIAVRRSPVLVAGGGTNWEVSSVGHKHTCALRTTGRAFCWGADGKGQLGNGGPNADRATPGILA